MAEAPQEQTVTVEVVLIRADGTKVEVPATVTEES